jgi:hypothetical protein
MKSLHTKLALSALGIAMLATPALAGSYGVGAGNVAASKYEATTPQNDKIAVRQRGLNAYAMVPHAPAGSDPNSPAATGGGSLGYNQMLYNNEW